MDALTEMSRNIQTIARELFEPDGTSKYHDTEEVAAYKPLKLLQVLHLQRKEAPSIIHGLRFAQDVVNMEALLCVVDGEVRIAPRVHFDRWHGVDYVVSDVTDYLRWVVDDMPFGTYERYAKIKFEHINDSLIRLLPDGHFLKVPFKSRQTA